jgi:Mg-chelatase subunit ChlD
MVKKSTNRILMVIAWILVGIEPGIASPSQAQGAYRVVINYPEISETSSGVSMGLYFSILDSADQIVPDAQVQSAAFYLGNGSVVSASPRKPSSNAYIVMVLDSSGSMSTSMPQMIQAAIQAVQSAPEEAVFAVIQFNTDVTLVQDFSNDREQIAEQISKIYAVPGSGTCLYDAAFRSVEIIQGAPRGRRAVVLLTDGKDELTEGKPCSQHTYPEVLALATRQEARVPIHTIGLSSSSSTALNEAQLREMATTTGGFAEFGEQSSLALLFTKIINSLSYQWLAQAEIYPSKGENTLYLRIALEGGTILQSGPFTFTSNQDYVAPPSAMVKTVAYTQSGDVIVNLDLQNENLIEEFEIQVLDIKNNVLAPAFTTEVTDSLDIAASNFEGGNEYRLFIRGHDAMGKALFESTYDFRYDPSIPLSELSILTVELNKDAPEFIIEVRSKNLEEASGFEIWLIDEKSNTVVPGSKQAIAPNSTIHMPLEGIRNGAYSIVVTAIGPESEILAETRYENALYKLGLPTIIFQALRSNILLLAIIFLIFAASSAYLIKKLYLEPRKAKSAPILLEETVMKGDQSLDDWSEDALRLNKQRLREEARRLRRAGSEKAQAAIADDSKKIPDTVLESPDREEKNLPEEIPAVVSPAIKPGIATLIVERSPEGSYDGQEYLIKELPFTIGRSDASLELDFPFISRKHVEIFFRAGEVFIRDEDSRNKTFLDGEMITGKGDFPLRSGASIGLGKKFSLKFIMEQD